MSNRTIMVDAAFSGIRPKRPRHTILLAAGCGAALLAFACGIANVHAQDPSKVIDLTFEDGATPGVTGNVRYAAGVQGNGLVFDGYTTRIVRAAADTPSLGDNFTVSTWVAFNTYPWNALPLIDQSVDNQLGYSLSVDAFGHITFSYASNGIWRQLTTESKLPLKRLSMVTATFDRKSVTIYINGKAEVTAPIQGPFDQADKADIYIGRVREPQLPYPSWLIHPHDKVGYSLDGLLDNVEVLDYAVSAKEEKTRFTSAKAPAGDVIPNYALPAGPGGVGDFGAYYTSLKWDPAWDGLRRYGPDSDVVVRFEQSPMRLVFWQGTNFVPAWVTGNGKWYTDQFTEAWAPPGCLEGGDCEPMSDKHADLSKVTIMESTPARVVLRWRYALVESRYQKGANEDPDTGWFDWAEEYWYVYPDGAAIRKQTLWSSNLDHKVGAPHEWQESIVINGPGQKPEDNIAPDALTLANMAGETHTYTWRPKPDDSFDYPRGPDKLDLPAAANIQVVNLKAVEKPFQVVFPKNVSFSTYNGEKSYSMFEWWNHWPVGQLASSGRPAVAADRPSHSSLSHIYWDSYARDALTETKLLMTGMTTKAATALLPLARSWISPPTISGPSTVTASYDPAQRAFTIQSEPPVVGPLTLQLAASDASPLFDPAFVIEDWKGAAKVTVDGHDVDGLKLGYVQGLTSTRLVVYLPIQITKPSTVTITPVP
ncbi:LamG domain-containing protein [Asticcacaulis sp.]|uniref:LamG domain-containing protein n=1 Tax=Asticcacaulis sp. TaxID=1872648 RepID=UPI002C530B2D|nr:LamG domain-containing protein [Asticcacaulis sp.]HTM81537.1 LamG domain-containing protein [Asticcacaulis sp.]